jgi:hypothetical protein
MTEGVKGDGRLPLSLTCSILPPGPHNEHKDTTVSALAILGLAYHKYC